MHFGKFMGTPAENKQRQRMLRTAALNVMCNRPMKYLSFLLLFISISTEAVSVNVLSNTAIKAKYGIRIELAEKSIVQCNDYVIYAPLEARENELGLYALEKIDSVLFSKTPNLNDILVETDYKNHSFEIMGEHARVLGCVKKEEIGAIYFKFLYLNEGSPSVVLVAPLM